MVLVLQAKPGDRELDKSIFVRLEPVPVRQYVEQGHSEGQPCTKIPLDAMTDLFEMTDRRQQREDCFYDHAYIPGPAWADLQVRQITHLGMKVRIGQDDHHLVKLGDHGLKGRGARCSVASSKWVKQTVSASKQK
jgi:hypothetical protein